tara:strand:+ start:511 stop:657 length:147 start_codon:yes stop_codon:yes gene_type:complete
MEDKGLGDTIGRFTKATGIQRLADKLGDCGCKKRRDFLNKKFPFNKTK